VTLSAKPSRIEPAVVMPAWPAPPGAAAASGDSTGDGDLAHALMRHATNALLVLTEGGAIRYASASTGRVLGYAPETLRGASLARLVHADDAATLAEFCSSLPGNDGTAAPIALRLHHGELGWRHFLASRIDLRDEPGVQALVISLHDVTARRQSERQSAAFLALGQQLGAATTAEEAARIIARVSDDLLRWDAYFLSLYSAEDDLLTPILSIDLVNGQRTVVAEVDPVGERPGPVWRRILTEGGVLILRHGLPTDPGGLEPFGDVERLSASLIFVPIRADNVAVGILSIQSYTEDAYNQDDVALLQALADHCSGALERVRAEAALRASEARLRHQATHDALTGLPNRAFFQERLAHTLASRTRAGTTVAVLFIDLDRFKIVNDSLGHEAGDALLVLAAARLRAALRPTDIAARLGGDEFTVLLDGLAADDDARRVAERIVALFERPFALADRQVVVSASIGIALGVVGDDAPTELLRRADIALYGAKNGGRARYAVFDAAMSDAAVERLELEAELRRAIAHGALQLHYQPVAELASGRIVGVEALVRWQRDAHGLVGPETFIPLAEETGLILPLGRWILHEACRQASTWRARNPQLDLRVSVNLSASEFAQPGLAAAVALTLQETGLDASALELEITESANMANAALTSATLR
jgi:diguanylate cyclase (GGDEF)-like protein/PAS domain S-box-containing protein